MAFETGADTDIVNLQVIGADIITQLLQQYKNTT